MLPTQKCTGCETCRTVCPRHCISMKINTEGFLYPEIKDSDCIHCGICEKKCPVLNLKEDDEISYPKAIAAYSTDENIRRNSSSGGVFTAMAERILNDNGVVCGAAMDDTLTVEHIIISKREDLSRLRGSKYVQSRMGDCFIEIKKYLDLGRAVLFSGTPCQVEGLLNYLNKPYENLFIIDIICHGVPSDKVWKAYLAWRKGKKRMEAISANFRDKITGWSQFSMSITYPDGCVVSENLKDDVYLRAFLQSLCLRESCYSCDFKTINRKSDLTIGDLWGIDSILPEWNDDKGVSVVLIQSAKGESLLKSCEAFLTWTDIDSKLAIDHNGAMTQSVYRDPMRDYFFIKLGKWKFDRLVSECMNPGYLTRLERKLLIRK